MSNEDFAAQPFREDENAMSGDHQTQSSGTTEQQGQSSPFQDFPSTHNIYMGNLSTGMTLEDIRMFLGTEECVVALKEGKKSHHCFVTVAANLVEAILAKDGEMINGRAIRVEPVMGNSGNKTPDQILQTSEPGAPTKDQDGSQGNSSNNNNDNNNNNSNNNNNNNNIDAGKTNELYVRFQGHMRPWDVPKYSEVANAAVRHFQQEGMICTRIYKGSEIIYKLIFRTQVEKVGHQLEFNVEGTTYQVPVYTYEPQKQEERRDGLLITLKKAATGAAYSIPAAEFDKILERHNLELIVPTKLQRVKHTQVFNGNRFCVIKPPEDLKRIPSTISIPYINKTFNFRLTFNGMEYFCSRCHTTHTTQCPELKKFYEAKERKEEMENNGEIQTKIYSDSTLRKVDTLGLTADVCAMSGGGLGQIIQATLDDPFRIAQDRLVIMGGTNDKKEQNFPSTEQFAANVDKSLLKLEQAAANAPNIKIYLAQQHPYDGDNVDNGLSSLTVDQMIRNVYTNGCIDALADKLDNVEVLSVTYEADPTGHPSDLGTQQILQQLHDIELTPAPLIWNNDFIVSAKPYQRVEAIYRYGCNSCDKFGDGCSRERHSHQLLCDDCFEEIENIALQPNPRLQGIIERINHLEQRANEERETEGEYRDTKRMRTEDTAPNAGTRAEGDNGMDITEEGQ